MKIKLCVAAIAVLVMWGMKRHYAEAAAEDLRWVLAPTSELVEVMTGATFSAEPGRGYLSRDRLFLIEKSCAGVNFLIAAFGMLMFALRRRIESWVSGGAVLAVGVIASYTAAVVVNAVRIAIAMWLADHPIAASAFSAAQLHRLEGITVYFCGLVLLHEIAQRVDRSAGAAVEAR
jgi:exosortase K